MKKPPEGGFLLNFKTKLELITYTNQELVG